MRRVIQVAPAGPGVARWAGGKAGGYGCPNPFLKGRLKPTVGPAGQPGTRRTPRNPAQPPPEDSFNYLVALVQQASEAGRAITTRI